MSIYLFHWPPLLALSSMCMYNHIYFHSRRGHTSQSYDVSCEPAPAIINKRASHVASALRYRPVHKQNKTHILESPDPVLSYHSIGGWLII